MCAARSADGAPAACSRNALHMAVPLPRVNPARIHADLRYKRNCSEAYCIRSSVVRKLGEHWLRSFHGVRIEGALTRPGGAVCRVTCALALLLVFLLCRGVLLLCKYICAAAALRPLLSSERDHRQCCLQCDGTCKFTQTDLTEPASNFAIIPACTREQDAVF